MKRFLLKALSKLIGYEAVKSCLRPLAKYIPILIKSRLMTGINAELSNFEIEKKFVFVHIPKTAGKAIYKTIFDAEHKAHFTVGDYERVLGGKLIGFKYFCVVRNPWDRVVSAFFYLKQSKEGYAYEFSKKYLSEYSDFKAFIRQLKCNPDLREKVLAWDHFRPQVEFIRSPEGVLVEGVIGRFEDLPEFCDVFTDWLGFERIKLAKLNASKRDVYRNYYDDESQAIVATLYNADIEMFGYVF